ncbi:DUF5017 domain-containing protein [Mucilaginibacter sp. PAMB04274]|uniref:DUF5017 domain-containing protein n=1 Tax=Mucilaginibacter sp. PAMB04274 TaxID=3138568 RepID=UPI0031F63850
MSIKIKIFQFITPMVAALLLGSYGCSKKNEAEPISFDVTTTKVNGTSTSAFGRQDTVIFKFSGNPDMITFYSGEVGKRYEYISRTNATGTPQLQFSSLRANGSQAGSLSLLISTDFKGAKAGLVNGVFTRDTAGTNANIAAATWTDITGRATLSTGAAAAVSSGTINLSEFSKGQPVFLAFKYTAAPGSIQNKWTITNFAITNVLSDNTSYTIANLNGPASAISNYGVNTFGPGWAVSFDPAKNTNNIGWVYTDKTSLVITGAATAAAATAGVEAWAITGPIDLTRVTPDAGTSIKNITAKLPSYQYNYAAPGKYNAVFVAVNATSDESRSLNRTASLTVNP